MTLTTPDVDEVAREIGALGVDAALRQSYQPHYNIAPTTEHPILLVDRTLVGARWGLGERVQINIRKETFAHRKADFVSCVVPADGFFEWIDDVRGLPAGGGGSGASEDGRAQARPPHGPPRKKTKKHRKPIWFHPERGLLRFAGMAEKTNTGGIAFSLFTVAANEQMKKVHDRMPAILTPAQADAWLVSTGVDERKALLQKIDWQLVETPVIPRANSVKFDDPECLTPASPDEPQKGQLDLI